MSSQDFGFYLPVKRGVSITSDGVKVFGDIGVEIMSTSIPKVMKDANQTNAGEVNLQVDDVLHDVIKQLLQIAYSNDSSRKSASIPLLGRIFSKRVTVKAQKMSQAEAARKALQTLENFQPSRPAPRFRLPQNIDDLLNKVLPTDRSIDSLTRCLDTSRGVQRLLMKDSEQTGKLRMSLFEGELPKTAIYGQPQCKAI